MFSRHVIAALSVAGLLTASPAAAQDGNERAEGESAFKARCAKCHTPAALRGYLAKRPEDAAVTRELETFLARHHARDAAERKAIIAWLLTQRNG